MKDYNNNKELIINILKQYVDYWESFNKFTGGGYSKIVDCNIGKETYSVYLTDLKMIYKNKKQITGGKTMENKIINAFGKSFQFTNGLNVITGRNASGKTRLIKAFVDSIGDVYQVTTKEELLNLYKQY